jgi:hypothetical protein
MARKKRKIKNSAADRKKQKKNPQPNWGTKIHDPSGGKAAHIKKQKKNRAREIKKSPKKKGPGSPQHSPTGGNGKRQGRPGSPQRRASSC